MTRKKIQDIITKSKSLPGKETNGVKVHNYFTRAKPSKKPVKTRKTPKGKIVFAGLLCVLLLLFAAKAINAFSKAIIRVSLHEEIINVDTVLKAGKSSSESLDLTFKIMETEATEQQTAPATGVENIEKNASGKIVVYNAYSSQPQVLVERTRFETPDGKIYRIENKITIPGLTKENGKTIPGSVEATIYADKAGEEYNIDLSDFKIPGFKGGERYEKFYARSKTPMTGGYAGKIAVVSEEDREKIEQAVEKNIRENLTKKTESEKPGDFIFYKDGTIVTFSENEIPEGEGQNFVMKKTGTLLAYLFSEKELSFALVKKYLGEDLVDRVRAVDLGRLNFEFVNIDKERDIIIFKLKGQVTFVWTIDEDTLKRALVDSSKNLEEVFSQYPAIEHASVIFKPSWWHFFPNESERIEIQQSR